MPRPEKPKSERRTGQIVVYVHEPVKEELQREADAKGISVSLLVRELLEAHVSGDKNDDRRIVVHPDVVYTVLRQLQQEGFEISDKTSDKFAPNSKSLPDANLQDTTYPQPSVDNPVDSVGDKSSANISPKTKRRGKGGEGNDT